MSKLTEKQRNCLEDYNLPEEGREPTCTSRWMKAGIAGLVFGNWSDDDIAEAAREMARDSRQELSDAIAKTKNESKG